MSRSKGYKISKNKIIIYGGSDLTFPSVSFERKDFRGDRDEVLLRLKGKLKSILNDKVSKGKSKSILKSILKGILKSVLKDKVPKGELHFTTYDKSYEIFNLQVEAHLDEILKELSQYRKESFWWKHWR